MSVVRRNKLRCRGYLSSQYVRFYHGDSAGHIVFKTAITEPSDRVVVMRIMIESATRVREVAIEHLIAPSAVHDKLSVELFTIAATWRFVPVRWIRPGYILLSVLKYRADTYFVGEPT